MLKLYCVHVHVILELQFMTAYLFFLLATIPCLMAGLPQPCIRALTSRIVDHSEQGKCQGSIYR